MSVFSEAKNEGRGRFLRVWLRVVMGLLFGEKSLSTLSFFFFFIRLYSSAATIGLVGRVL